MTINYTDVATWELLPDQDAAARTINYWIPRGMTWRQALDTARAYCELSGAEINIHGPNGPANCGPGGFWPHTDPTFESNYEAVRFLVGFPPNLDEPVWP